MSAFSPAALTAFVLLAAASLTLAPAPAAPVELHVSPRGNDAWSGRAKDPGAPNGPFATLARAQQEIRALKAAGAAGGVTVYVRGGTYYLAQTLSLGAEDSGTPEAPVVIRAYSAEKPVLVGGRKITGCRPYKDKIVQCDLKPLGLADVYFRQLFFRGERQVLARCPNQDPKDPHGGTWAYVMAVEGDDNKTEFTYAADVEHNWAKPQEAEVCLFPGFDWAWNRIPVKQIVRAERKIVLAGPTSYALRVGDRYYVQNVKEELDSPGEWYLDKQTAMLYFWPPADLAAGPLVAPTLRTIVEMKGAHHVTLRGFTLEACDGDAVTMTDCEKCLVAQNVVRNTGAAGIVISGGKESGAAGNDIHAVGGCGVSLGGGDRKTLTPAGNFATNNYIHHNGVYHRTYNGGVNCSGVGNIVSHNLIHDCPHAGLNLSGNDNLIEFNRVHHVNLQSADTGGIYFCSRDWTQRGNIIRYNDFHDSGGFGKAWRSSRPGTIEFSYPHFTWGIYLDDPTTGTLVYGNIVYHAAYSAMHNHGGRDNTWENNIIVDCPALAAGMLDPNWGEWPPIYQRLNEARYPGSPYLQKYPELANYADTHPEAMTGVKFIRNIVYYTANGSARMREENASSCGPNGLLLYSMTMRTDDFAQNAWDYNTIYCPPELSPKISLSLAPDPWKMRSWDDWRALGAEAHSVLADPRFVDAQKRDYRLRPDSPALKLGFKPIPVDKIGPYQDELRASWPVVEAPGATALGDFVTHRFVELPEYALTEAREFTPRGGASNFVAKAEAGGPVKVAYYGGGIHSADGWRKIALDALRQRFPKAQITEIDGSICDCVRGSGFSVYRFQHDILAQKPDLVLVDFASDDYQTDPKQIWRAVEPVVRQSWQASPQLDLLFVYAFRDGFEQEYANGKSPLTVSAYEKLADHYGVPSVNMGFRVARLAAEGRMLLKASEEEAKKQPGKPVFSRDGVRPLPEGNRVYADAIIAGLEELAKQPKPGPHELKPPFDRSNYERARQVAITESMLSGNWQKLPADDPLSKRFASHFDTIWFTNTSGAKLSFTFKGTEASIYDLMGPDTGRVKVTVDGKEMGVRQQVDPWAYFQRQAAIPIASGLPDAVHAVTLELLPEPPDRSVPIESAKKQANFDMKVFEGVALRVGFIRIVGEMP